MMLVYSIALGVALAASAPWWLLRMATTRRYREGLRQRLGRVPEPLLAAVSGQHVIWIHAVSVGEVLAVTRLVRELEAALGEGWRIVLSTTTRTGQELARQRFGAERVFYFPLDFAFAVRAYLEALQPSALVLAESELWPRVLHECRERRIPVAVVNARVSDRSFARTQRVRGLWLRMAANISLWLAQSELDAQRLVALGAFSERVRITGNLKYDVQAPSESRLAALIRDSAAGRQIIVAGSTLGNDPPEDSLLIRVQQSLPEAQRPLLVLAPRRPEKFGVIYSIAREYPAVRATDMLQRGEAVTNAQIVVLDTIGDLASLFAVADIAYIGGSMVRRGGHNPLEAAQFGVPVVMGPSFENFRDIVQRMKAADAICILGENLPMSYLDANSVRDAKRTLYDALDDAVRRMLAAPDAARAFGERGRQVFLSQQGATERSIHALLALVQR